MGESSKDQLSLDNLGDLLEAIYTANPKWYNLGLRLGLHPSVLDAIRTRCQHNPEECLVEVLKEWLKRGGTEPTWRELARALMSTAVGEGALAGKLLAKCRPLDPVQQQSVESVNVDAVFNLAPVKSRQEPSQTVELAQATAESGKIYPDGPPEAKPEDYGSEVGPESSHKSLVYSASFSDQPSSDTSTKELKPRQAFGCGCGKCNLTTFLEKGCPEPVNTLSNFPYLQTTGLSQGELMILKGRLFNEFQLITRSFSCFNSAICKSLIKQEISVKELARVLRDLRAFQPSRPDIPLLRDKFNDIKVAEDIDDVFDILADYVSFFSFHITEHIVENLGTADDKRLLADYKKKLEGYCKRNIFECPSYSAPKQGVAELVMKVEGIEKYNLKHLAELISHVSKVISVSQHTLQLCSVEKGCVQLNFQIPGFVKYYIFPFDEEQMVQLEMLGIILVQCDKWKYDLTTDKRSPQPSPPSLPLVSAEQANQPSPQSAPPRSLSAPALPAHSQPSPTPSLVPQPSLTSPLTSRAPSKAPPPEPLKIDAEDGEGMYATIHTTTTRTAAKQARSAHNYNHGNITRQESEHRLTLATHDCFLLRESESRPGCLTLSVKQSGELRHVLIEHTEVGYVAHGESEPFQSMQSFMDHVSRYLRPCPIPSEEDTDSTVKRDKSDSNVCSGKPHPPSTEGWLSDYTSDYSGTGDTAGDWTGTGDSGVILRHAHLPPPVPPKHTGPRYEKIRSESLDKEHQYSRVKNSNFVAVNTDRPLSYPFPTASKSPGDVSERGQTTTMPSHHGAKLKMLLVPLSADSEPVAQDTVKHYENLHN